MQNTTRTTRTLNVCMCQVGDILDRGDQEVKLLYMLERLQHQAAAAGGALWVLNGNHGEAPTHMPLHGTEAVIKVQAAQAAA